MAPTRRSKVGHGTPILGAKGRTVVSSRPRRSHLWRLRHVAELSQIQLAREVGVDNSLISRLESGERDLRSVGYETVVRIAAALNVTPGELFPLTERSA